MRRRRSASAAPAADGVIPASRCPRCRRACAPPTRYCPDDGTAMAPTTLPARGEVVSFTTLYSPPTGFTSPLHLALVELPGGARFFCHGTDTKGLRLGSRVAIEAVDDIYYFSTLSLAERAGLFWRRRAETATGRVSAFAGARPSGSSGRPHEAPRRRPRHRSDPRAGGPLRDDAPGRHGRRGYQGRGAGQGGRHPRLARLRRRRVDLLHERQPRQEEPHARPQGGEGQDHPPEAPRRRRRPARELPPRHARAARLRLGGRPRAEPAPRVRLDLRLRRVGSRGEPARLRPDRAGRVGDHGPHGLSLRSAPSLPPRRAPG